LTRLRLSQAELYYFMVSHCGNHAYQASRDFKKAKGVYRFSDYANAVDPNCKTVQLYGKHYDQRRKAA